MAEWNLNPQWNELETINDGFDFKSFSDISASDFNKLVENMQYLYLHNTDKTGGLAMDRVYPVGSIYMTLDKTFNPAEVFGGTWVRLEDRFLLGASDTYGAGTTGGSADAVVVSHSHKITKLAAASKGIASDGSTLQKGYGGEATSNIANGTNYTISTVGVDGKGKNMPPYLAVYMWQRTPDEEVKNESI